MTALAFFRKVGVVVAKLDTRVRREPFDRTHKIEVLNFAHEADRVAAGLAPKAVVRAHLGVDRETRRFLVVERAQSAPTATDPPQRDVFAREFNEVGCLAYSPHVFVENAHLGSG